LSKECPQKSTPLEVLRSEVKAPEDVQEAFTAAANMRSKGGACVEACVRALQKSGIEIHQYHTEGSSHRFEISLAPLRVLESVDALVFSQEVIKQTAQKHGFWATFLPRPYAKESFNGLHMHFSIDKCSGEVEDQFLAGVLHRLPLLAAFGMANPYGHLRQEDVHGFSDWVSWGTLNRDTPIRKIEERHWEFKAMDFALNPHIVAAAYVAAGILGVLEKENLVWKDCRVLVDSLDEKSRAELGITTRMPTDIHEKLALLEHYMGLEKLLGVGFLDFYRAVKKAHQVILDDYTEEETWAYYSHQF